MIRKNWMLFYHREREIGEWIFDKRLRHVEEGNHCSICFCINFSSLYIGLSLIASTSITQVGRITWERLVYDLAHAYKALTAHVFWPNPVDGNTHRHSRDKPLKSLSKHPGDATCTNGTWVRAHPVFQKMKKTLFQSFKKICSKILHVHIMLIYICVRFYEKIPLYVVYTKMTKCPNDNSE
jgi:hypothetical protein